MTIRILFVCTANICRSPYMEIKSRDMAGTSLAVSSAGTHGFIDHPMSSEMHPGLDDDAVVAFRSRKLTRDLVTVADLVLTAEAAHRRFILDEQPGAFRRVFTIGQFAQAIRTDESGSSGRALLQQLGERRGTADPTLDVPDPYRLGPDVAATCARTIDDLLRVIVPTLTGSRMIGP